MEELNPAPPKTNTSSGRKEDLKPGPPDYKSNALPLGHARLPKAFTFVLPKQVDNLIDFQEYPTEPLDKIPALQGRIALAGKLTLATRTCWKIYMNTTLAGNLCCNAGSS